MKMEGFLLLIRKEDFMALIQLGRNGTVSYGSKAVFSFTVRFPSQNDTSQVPFNTYQPMTPTNLPTVGTLTIAGVAVTLIAEDITSPELVAKKIAAATIANFTVSVNSYNPKIVQLQSTALGSITKPTAVLGTATNILFYDINFTNGALCPLDGDYDDIYVGNSTPVTLWLETANCTPTIKTSNGNMLQQQLKSLTYGSALTLGTVNGLTNAITLSNPISFIRVTTTGVGATSYVILHVNK
jgi:hypothetical protein